MSDHLSKDVDTMNINSSSPSLELTLGQAQSQLDQTEFESSTASTTPPASPSPPPNPWGKSISTFSSNNSTDAVTGKSTGAGIGTVPIPSHVPIINFKSIMADQEEESNLETALDLDLDVAHHDIKQQTFGIRAQSEEEMIRLAIEASLKDAAAAGNHDAKPSAIAAEGFDQKIGTAPAATAAKPPPFFTNTVDDDEMDADMRLAIQLSMAEMNGTSNIARYEVDIDKDHDHGMDMGMDSKLPASSISTPSAPSTPKHRNKGVTWEDERKPSAAPVLAASATSTSVLASTSASASASATAAAAAAASTAISATAAQSPSSFITKEEEEEIARAILEADDRQQAESLKLAMELQAEENRQFEKRKVDQVRNNSANSNVRTVTKAEFQDYESVSADGWNLDGKQEKERKLWGQDDYEEHNSTYGLEIRHEESEDCKHSSKPSSGFQINASTPSKAWSRLDRNTILGPNNEVRTKHDVLLKNQSNADRLLGAKSSMAKKGGMLSVSDTAYNSLNRSLKNSMKRQTVKGVQRSGTGRAENMNEKTRGGAMDGNVRLLITKAINSGLIQHCNGVVKEGKEAVVYHADAGSQSDSFDVAVKVFKRIQEFRNRSAYMDNDPRYYGQKFRNADKRQQVELWAEKEYRNLVRASRAGVAVPTPLSQKDNVLFMRFLGEGGWPAAQLREVEIKKRSKKWTALYMQSLVAIRRLFHCARLVHADLSEYNILICPMSQVENAMDKSEESKNDLQVVLIDFGQAVEVKHPSAMELLKRDLSLVNSFFAKQDIATLSVENCESFVVEPLRVELADQDDDDLDETNNEESAQIIIGCDEDGGNDDESRQWRHSIKGWSDEEDLKRLECMLTELKVQSGGGEKV